MGAAKDMWMGAVDSVCEAYRAGNVELSEAVGCLTRMGFDQIEAETMLKEATA